MEYHEDFGSRTSEYALSIGRTKQHTNTEPELVHRSSLPVPPCYHFSTQACTFVRNADLAKASTNVMDRWITASLHGLIKFVREEMEAYRLYTVVPRLLSLIERLTNWYVRFNRLRLKGDTGAEDQLTCLSVLYEVLYSLCLLMAPFMPFITEYMYQNLKKAIPAGTFAAEQAAAGGESKGDDGVVVVANAQVDGVVGDESVHYMDLPNFDASVIDEEAEETMEYLTQVIVLGRAVRQRRNRPTKTAFIQ